LPWTPCPALPRPAPTLPCPALPCPYPALAPALAPALPCFEFSFCCQGQEEEVTHGTFFPFAARDRRRKLHMELFFLLLPGTGGGSYTLPCKTDRQTDKHVAFIYKIAPWTMESKTPIAM